MPIKGIKGGVGTKALGYGLGAAQEASEPHFNQTTLLLHADGSEGEGNTSALGDPNYKAFRDNSTSAHALAVAGDAYGNDFSPYYYADGYWSNLFTVNNTDIEFTSTSNVQLDGVFTIEFFVQVSTLAVDSQHPSVLTFPTNGSNITQVYINATNKYVALYYGSDLIKTDNDSITLNTWHHVVVARDSSSNIALWLNGSRVSSFYTGASKAVTFGASSGDFNIGSYNGSGGEIDGYLSNVRIVKGYDVYGTTNTSITVPTAPLTAVTGTGLLTCQSNRFIDNASSPHTLTIGSGQSISTNTPFTQSKTANVGSGFFDGNTDNLTTTGSSDFAFGTGDYTFEAWVYPFSLPSVAVVLDLRYSNNNNADNISALTLFNATLGNYSGGNYSAGTDIPVIINQWNHIAIQRISGTQYYAVNGKVSSTTSSLTNNLNNASQRATIGGNVDQTTVSMYTGYIADLRVVNGTGVYGTSDFDVPTTSLTAITNTKLLTCQYSGAVRNVGFLDDSKYNHQITRNGHVYLGTFSPFSAEEGYWSRYTDGTTNTDNHGSGITLGTNNFTIGMFVFPLSSLGSRTTLYADSAATSIIIAHDQLLVDAGSTWTITIDYTTDIVPGQWQWIQVDRTGSTFRVSIDGSYVDGGGATSSGTIPAISLGQFGQRGGQARFIGHYSNFILINGANRGSIATPTAPLTANSDTAILTHQNSRFINNGNTSLTLTSGPDARSLPFSPYPPTRSYSKDVIGGSAYFDGDTDYLSIPDSELFTLGTENFTIECWVYFNSVSGTQYVYGQSHGSAGSDTSFQLYINSGNLYAWTGHGSASATAPKANEWVHLAFVRQGANIRIYYNGVQQDSTNIGASNALTNSTGVFALGRVGAHDGDYFAGYISNFNFVRGVCKYDDGTAFNPPTAPITAHANTIFLANFTNAGIIDHTMKNNLDTVNNVRIRTGIKKFGTGSIYFDGSDSIRWNQTDLQNEGMAIGTGPFTIEFFVYFDGDPNNGGTNGQASLIRDAGGSLVIQRYDGEWEAGNESTPQIQVAQSLSNQTWYHVAMTRDSSANLRLFIDGTQAGSTATSHTTDFSKNEWHLGALNADASGGRALTGYMDEIRITAGVARYTSNFTAPTESFANR
jgi:hypothetical protein